MIPRHEVNDWAKVEALAESMERDGWQGAPLVRWDNYLITGTHRYYAASRLLEWSDGKIPTITLEELYEEAGMDFAEMEEALADYVICANYDELLVNELPAEIREKYGIDL